MHLLQFCYVRTLNSLYIGTYGAFGDLIASSGSTDNAYGFAGEQFDSGLDQYYLRARYYDQSNGRFTRRDDYEGEPEEPSSLSKYIYVKNDPINFIDLNGYQFTLEQGKLVHQIIALHFISSGSNRLANREINTILRQRSIGFNPNAQPYPTRIRARPDLIDVFTQELYEIKTRLDGESGYPQLLGYMSLLNNPQVRDFGWHEGVFYVPPSTLSIPGIGQIVIDPPQQNPYAGGNNGVITYERIRTQRQSISVPKIDLIVWVILASLLVAAAAKASLGQPA